MPGPPEPATVTVALLGNPNTGKSTLFQALSGLRQRVGNYPGVTVEKKVGQLTIDGRSFTLVDLPGTYSLAPRALDEMVTVDVVLGRRPDVAAPAVVLCIVDASNLERNLYLVSQVLELSRPTVVALNMTDVAAEKGIGIDVDRLRHRLGIPVIATQAHRREGLAELKQALQQAAETPAPAPRSPFPPAFQDEVAALERALRGNAAAEVLPRYLVERLLLDTGGYLQQAALPGVTPAYREQLAAARQRLAAQGLPVPAIEAQARYEWAAQILDGVVTRPAEHPVTFTDRLDRVLTHRLWGTLLFAVLMLVMFQSVFRWSHPAMDAIEAAVDWAGDRVEAALPAGALRSLLVDGVIAGAGGVLTFLPQILVLFLFIAVLEDCGYMARAAYLMDKLMAGIGLSGKSFIPLLSSFACAVPGILATRVIEHRRDRLVTILIAPLMSCSARLPVYTLLIAAFIPDRRYLGGWLGLPGITMFALYLVGIVAAVGVALVLGQTVLRGAAPPFLMELPSYKRPSLRNVAFRMAERGWAFVHTAGTLILAVTIVVWAAGYFPHPPAVEQEVRGRFADRLAELAREQKQLARLHAGALDAAEHHRHNAWQQAQAALDAEIARAVSAAYLDQSFLGRAGRWIEPLVRPLGWDWRIGCAVIASFPAREVVIGTLGVIYHMGDEPSDEDDDSLRETLRTATWQGTDRPVFNVPVALSIMVFFALCAQCAATLAVIRQETNSWRWPVFTFAYMTALAYVGALVTYQAGMWLGG